MGASRSIGPDPLPQEDVDEAVDVLHDVLQWELAAARWEQVERLVQALSHAVATADRDAFRAALTELEVLGPVRVTRLGAAPVVPAPDPIRERANRLVHDLLPAPTSSMEPGDRPSRR